MCIKSDYFGSQNSAKTDCDSGGCGKLVISKCSLLCSAAPPETVFLQKPVFWNQPLAIVRQLIDQFSILTKLTNCVIRGSQQYHFTQTYQLYLFRFELNN